MKIKKYLAKKYGFELNAKISADLIDYELQVTEEQRKDLIRYERGTKRSASDIYFHEFCNICQNYLA